MGRRMRLLVATTAAVLTTVGCTPTLAGRNGGGNVTRVSFVETSHEGDGTSVARTIAIHVYQAQGHLRSMRFVTRADGNVAEERLWDAAQPDTITIRSWWDCRQSTEPMPGPRPANLDAVLEEYFGARIPPPDRRTSADGSATWQIRVEDTLTKTFIDNGGAYPGGRVVQIGADGQIGSTITAGTVTEEAQLPAWAPGWERCH